MKKRHHPLQRANTARSGFSLLELLTVLAIMGIVMAIIVPAVGNILRSSGLSQAGDQLVSTLSYARQTAIARNRAVEVRFYNYADAASSGGRFRAIQSFLIESGTSGTSSTPIGRKQTFPATVYISSAKELSSLMDPSLNNQVSGTDLGQPIPQVGLAYTAVRFRFRPDGSTDLTSFTNKAFVTFTPASYPDNATTPPPNFVTVLLQPNTGKIKLLRP